METLTKFEALLGELEPYNPKSVTIKKALADAEKAEKGGNLDIDGDGQIGLSDIEKATDNTKGGAMDGTTFTNFIEAYLQYISK